MAKITITRKKTWIGSAVAHHVFLDNIKIGKLWSGKTQSFEISPGEHTLQIKYDVTRLNRSPRLTFSIKENEEIKYISKFTRFTMTFTIAISLTIIMIGILMGSTSLLSNLSKFLRPIVMMLPIILIFFVATYIWREKFIKIEEVERFTTP
jgi:hypothetical protein